MHQRKVEQQKLPKGEGAAGGAGRKTDDWGAKAQLECDGFAKPGERDPFWWGSEAKTKVKGIEKWSNGMRQRCRNSSDMNEVEQLQKDASTCCLSC